MAYNINTVYSVLSKVQCNSSDRLTLNCDILREASNSTKKKKIKDQNNLAEAHPLQGHLKQRLSEGPTPFLQSQPLEKRHRSSGQKRYHLRLSMPKRKVPWGDAPPQPFEPESLAEDVSCQGILARTLWEALSPSEASTDQASEDDDVSPNISLSPAALDAVMSSLGRSMSNSSVLTGQHTEPAPAAVLKGNVVSFNRNGSKWRILVKDSQIRPRQVLNLPKKRGPSLWEAHSQRRGGDTSDVKEISGILELLVYDDVD